MSVIGKPRDERGAVAPFVAVLIVFLVGLASFAVDLGYQRVAARDMQAVADIVAMDMARQLDGTKGNVLKNTDRWKDAVRASLARNDDQTVGDSLTAVPCGESLNTLPNNQSVVCATPGIYNPATGDFTLGGNQPATHVRVVTRTRVDYFFPVFADDGWVTKVAYAQADASACFRLGSVALALESEDSGLLNALIGDALDLGVLGYDGLATAEVSLLGISTELGLGSVDELLALTDLSIGDLAIATARALANNGGDTAAIELLNLIGANVGALPPIRVADIVEIAPGSSAALDAGINVLDLISTAAFLANGDNLLAVPDLKAEIPGIASVGAELRVIAAPALGCGKVNVARARNSQIFLDLNVGLLEQEIGLPPLLGLRAATTLAVSVRVGDARGTLRDIRCVRHGGVEGIDVSVASALTQALVSLKVDLSARVLGLRVPVAKVTAAAGTDEGPETRMVAIDVPPLDYRTPVSSGKGDVGLSGLKIEDLRLEVLGVVPIPLGLLGELVSAIIDPIVNPLISRVDSILLGPLANLLGANIAGADVFIGDGRVDPPRRPTCSAPALRG